MLVRNVSFIASTLLFVACNSEDGPHDLKWFGVEGQRLWDPERFTLVPGCV